LLAHKILVVLNIHPKEVKNTTNLNEKSMKTHEKAFSAIFPHQNEVTL